MKTIELNLAGRIYTLKINPLDEESLRKAANLMNKLISEKKQQGRTNEMQDLLTMVAFDLAVMHVKSAEESENALNEVINLRSSIAQLNQDYL